MSWMWISIAFTLTLVVGVLVVRLLVPAVSEASERVRIQREAQEASWRIHQHAAAAFGQLLDAARHAEAREES